MLKHWLMMDLAMEPFFESQMLIQTTAESELDDTLIMWGFKVRVTSLKIYICWIASVTISEVTISEVIGWLVPSAK